MKDLLGTYKISIIAAILFLIHQFLEPFMSVPLIDGYLDDVCFLPVCFGLITFTIRKTLSPQFSISWIMALIGWTITVIATEWLFPILSTEHTADPFDLIAYGAGGLLFMAFKTSP